MGESFQNVFASKLIERKGRKIGLVGASTVSTPTSGTKRFLGGFSFRPLAPDLMREAALLRSAGAEAVILLTHAGGFCRMDQPADKGDSACASPQKDEVTEALETLPPGTLDLVVAGHIHTPQAHFIRGTAVLQNYDSGLSFARAELSLPPPDGRERPKTAILGHTYLCGNHFLHYPSCSPNELRENKAYPHDLGTPVPATFLGREVVIGNAMREALAPYFSAVDDLMKDPVITLAGPVPFDRLSESKMGNCYAHAFYFHAAGPTARGHEGRTLDGAFLSSGGIRSGFPSKDVTFGHVFQSSPFDGDDIALVTLPAEKIGELATLIGRDKKNILAASVGWRPLVGKEDDNVARGVRHDNPDILAPGRRVTIMAFKFGLDGAAQLAPRLGLPESEIGFEVLPGHTRDRLAASLRALKDNPPRSCMGEVPARFVRVEN